MKAVKNVIVLGSGALKIGEAGEFDYSGSQAIKALKEEGIRTVLVNPNIATIQTSEELPDEVYFVPVRPAFVEQVIVKERPDGILLGFGGQTALNCGVALYQSGVLEKYGVEVLGTSVQTIINTEDREEFVARLNEIGVDSPRSIPTADIEEAVEAATKIGYPVMGRVAYALGGLGSGVCYNEEELRDLAAKAFAHTEQLLIEEYLDGWKEIEYEIVRDAYDNCITVCNMENLNPMGVHTGESIVVAPSQTLTNEEYHYLREIALKTVRHMGVVGECNIQYALSPDSKEYRVIEINARLSRSSALASKATGYPLAFVAAKLVIGRSLIEVQNSVTRATCACFEPALDYVVVKVPRWDLKKFQGVSQRIGSAMKSVGEVMSIGRKFEEALQKALRMLEVGAKGAVCSDMDIEDLDRELREPSDKHIWGLVAALEKGMTVEEINKITKVDRWFLDKLKIIVDINERLKTTGAAVLTDSELLIEAKKHGFSDSQIAISTDKTADEVYQARQSLDIHPWVKQIDTLAAEYPAATNYLYLTYNASRHDLELDSGGVAILGPGAYRIGSSVEFDWCCVNTVKTLRKYGYKTIMINHNPETVSTDYDECDRLYFEELSFETVRDIYNFERPLGLILSMGGQIPNNLAMPCHNAGLRVLGTSPINVDRAENRNTFSSMLERLNVHQPAWMELTSLDEVYEFAERVGYPVLIRPSYVLSGAAMAVAVDKGQLSEFLSEAVDISPEHPVVVSKFVENAKEIDVDAVAANGELVCWAVSEHVENGGVHSGDATLVLPPQRTYLETMRRIRKISQRVAKELDINGPFNIQFLAKHNDVMVIEVNLRASRSFPFVSKVLKRNFIEAATKVIMGRPIEKQSTFSLDLDYVGVKAPQFSFTRLKGADPTLGVEMASTGEVACLGWDFDEAFLKALICVGFNFPVKNVLLSTGPLKAKAAFIEGAKLMKGLGIDFYATGGTHDFLKQHGIDSEVLTWPLDEKPHSAIDVIRNRKVDLVINIPKTYQKEELTNDYLIRRAAVDFGIPLITNMQLAQRLAEALSNIPVEKLTVRRWSDYKI
ncbi:MAG: carbamoyl-phosphate synthase (glutamine-hydrolyzing) large subunit [Deltaproteobacteria bacterium]|nr:carbamoyl-phosphate synthase (glutamine-hydrolyzing) large subunit [Deltaproteobacteria bacterium]MBN2674017.1 carbamoyl-phosphate synthase (glutamine-hydrolyzing) large subunit [Deltaproteobacteria bacterium]